MSTTPNYRREQHGQAIVNFAQAGNQNAADDATDAITDILHYVAAQISDAAALNAADRAIRHFRAER